MTDKEYWQAIYEAAKARDRNTDKFTENPYKRASDADKLKTEIKYLNTIVERLDDIQEKEIERLKAENEELTKVVSSKVYDLIDNAKEIADAREAWEKQAKIDVLNKLQAYLYAVYGTNTAYPYYVYGTNRVPLGNKTAEDIVKNIDELIKEVEE